MLRLAWLCLASLLLMLVGLLGLDAYTAMHPRVVEFGALWSPEPSTRVVVNPARSRSRVSHHGRASRVRSRPRG
jgi:hypothetical protein